MFVHYVPAGSIEAASGSSQVGGVPSTRTLVSSHPPPYGRGVARPSITLRSASASSDSLRLRSPSWTTAERRAVCKVRRPWDEGGLESGYQVAGKVRPGKAGSARRSQSGRHSIGKCEGPGTERPLTAGLAADLLRMRCRSARFSSRTVRRLAHARPSPAAERRPGRDCPLLVAGGVTPFDPC